MDELAEAGVRPGALVASVGGGGLICGLYEGLARHGWDDVPLITAETDGACCFARAVGAGRPVRLDAITSVATSLGALQVSDTALARAQAHGATLPMVVSDAEAVRACVALLDDHRLLVEPACGAALALLYSERQRAAVAAAVAARDGPLVVVVCGGSGVDWEIMQQWRDQFL